jgi:hypothetical protein
MANEAHLTKLKEGVEAWNEWRRNNVGLGVCVAMERKTGKFMLPLPPSSAHGLWTPVVLAA